MRVELTTPTTGRVVKELKIQSMVRLSDIVDSVLSELKLSIRYIDLEPYYLVVVNGNQLGEGVRWSDVLLNDDDYVVILPFAFGGSLSLTHHFI
ncbi:MAG: hypothetical protein RMH77_05140 [Sulfolobales archaeon]|nr:hypothetical protein [Sulfolobales archaeon]MCX8186439.1 hypothetical protein [Sulfolobales archaeon]MDW7969769.1 hypothetical protein [Sulfolobales archaeon]